MKHARLLSIIASVIMLGLLVYLARRYAHELKHIPRVSPVLVVVIFALYIVMRAINGLMMKIALKALGYFIPFGEAVMLAILTTYANLLIPRAGLGLPALYLKVKRNVTYADFTSQSLIVVSLQVGAIGICGLICQGLLAAFFSVPFNPWIGGLFALSVVGGVGAAMIKPTIFPDSHGAFANFLHRIGSAWARIGSSRRTVLAQLLWNVPMLALRAWRIQIAFYAIGSEISFLGAFVASLLADLLFFVSITPGGLGFRELGITYVSTTFGISPVLSATAALLDRLIWTAGVVVLAQFGMRWMVRPALRAARQEPEPPGQVKVASSLEAQ